MPSFRVRRGPALLAAVAAVGLLLPTAASAGRLDDQREDLVARQRALIDEMDTLEATDEELGRAIEILDAYVTFKEAEVTEAQDILAQAMVTAQRAREEEAAKQAEVAALEERMAEMAIAAYVAPPQADQMETMLQSSAPSEAASLGVYLDVQNRRDTDIVRQLRRARAELGDQREQAELAEERAATAHEEASTQLAELVGAREQQQVLRSEVVDRLEDASFESGLVSIEISRINRQIIAEAETSRGSVPLTNVRGFHVHSSIASQLDALLAAAEADGILLGGGGHRSNQAQIALRIAHCGGDDPYSVFEKPSGECSPPTARPGTSMHELGLAIDFTYRGRTIESHSSPAFQWLAENAVTYGFYNLPSEPWHWSVNGN